MKNPADKVEQWPIDKLIPYAKNSRTHSDEQVAQIAASIKEWGFTTAVLVDESGSIIAGHCRVMAARKLGLTSLPVMVAAGWTDAQKRAYVIADNKLALNAGWDDAMLRIELEALQLEGFDLDITGFDTDALAELIAGDEQIEYQGDPDEVPEIGETPISVPGDVWIMGQHRLMCGDSTSVDAVDALMDGARADMVFTDPPYGMSYDGGRSKKGFGMIKNDDATGADLITLVREALATAKASAKQGAAAYVCFPWRTYSEFEAAMRECGMDISACIVWNKGSVGLGHQEYRPQHEFIFYSKGGAWFGNRSQSDVWTMTRGNTGAYVHPTQKPVELIEIAINNSSKQEDIVIDCFGGSGSTLMACERTGRHARLMELDPRYCDVIVKRWQEFTGKQAIHADTGKPFAEVTHGDKTEN